MAHQSWVGRTIGGRYQVEALLGQGGMSAVYRATDPNLRRTVAIKLIHPHLSTDPHFVGRFKEEAAAVARLRHPNIVQVHDFNVDGDTYYMVMEYLVGETLQAKLKRANAAGRRLSFAEDASICAQVCAAAGYAHNHDLIHRDIKPANIMLDVNGQAILMDFGIVKIFGGEYHTATGATVGTALYMSPEQIRSERVDERSDVYSLGVTLYEMISGHPPFEADSAVTLMMMVLNDPLPDLRKMRADLPPTLEAIVYRALAREPAQRFQTMAEMAAALRQFQAEIAGLPPAPAAAPAALAATQVEEAAPTAGLPASHEARLASPPAAAGNLHDKATEVEPAAALAAPPPATAAPSKPLAAPPPVTAAPSAPFAAPPPVTAAPSAPFAAPPPFTAAPPASRPAPPAAARAQKLRLVSLLAAGLVVVALAFLALVSLAPPTLELAPVSRAPLAVTAANAAQVVSLGQWQTASVIEDMVFAPDGARLATAHSRDWASLSRYRYYAAWWQTGAAQHERYLLGHSQWISGVAFSPDGKLFATASDDGNLRLFQAETGSLAREISAEYGGMTSVDFSPNNLLVAAGFWDGSIGLWQVSNGNLLRTFKDVETGIKDVVFSPGSEFIAGASEDGAIRTWRVSDGGLVHTLLGHTDVVEKVVYSPDGTRLASGSGDTTLRVWSAQDGALTWEQAGHQGKLRGLAFSPDGSLLVSGAEDGTLCLWRVSDGQLIQRLQEEDSITAVAFAPDGQFFVSGLVNGVLHFWGLSEALTP
jgi:serine/threonine-protein kinase